MSVSRSELPIDPLLPEITNTVKREPLLLLEADPGAGKTTRVPAALLQAGMHDVVVLEPRRLAARMAARRVSHELGENPGGLVGYQVRFEEVSSSRTRLWYVTEGVLTRRLLSDPLLKGVQVVILDEFHERHIETDLALSLLRKLQAKRRDLRLVIMSATLSGDNLSSRLDSPPVLKAGGRQFPVTTKYLPHSAAPLEEQVADAVTRALPESSGHTLVFLPGAAEIRRAIAACEPVARRNDIELFPLFGELSPEQQDAAVLPSARRKIICSTNVAESSITIDGVQTVIDSGLARVLSHSAWSGLSRLRIEKISKASAIQRAGRAGRTGPGLAIRLYPEADFVRRPEQTAPEIVRSDLAPLLLQIAAMGLAWRDLEWLDEPAPEILDAARDLLIRLEAIDASTGAITATGRNMSRLPVHPRLGRLVLQASRYGHKQDGAMLAARLSEGGFRPSEFHRSRFTSDIEALLAEDGSYTEKRLAAQIQNAVNQPLLARDDHGLEKAVLSAYPDRVARKRGETLLLSNGKSARLDRQSLVTSEFLTAVETEDRSADQTPAVRIASPIEPDWLLDLFPDRLSSGEELTWNREAERVEEISVLRYDALVIDETRRSPRDLSAAASLLVSKALERGVYSFTESEELERFLRRYRFAAQHSGEFSYDPEIAGRALTRLAEGVTSFSELRRLAANGGLLNAIESMLPMYLLDQIAPTHVTLASGRRSKIEYHEGRPPSVSSRLQDFFGMHESPAVAKGRVPLVVHLLAPNQRPVQVTTDLVSFWRDLYPQVRRELSRRYPRHSWPENPA